MRTVKIVRIIRKSSGVIDMYDVKIDNGNMERVSAKYLKDCIRTGKLCVDGYKLTSDNRLIKSGKAQAKKSKSGDIAYFIMNRDKAIAYADSQGKTTSSIWRLPIGYKDFSSWVESRNRFSCINNREELFRFMGVSSLRDLIEINHCVSLHDNFWVKVGDSKLSWEDVSPFKREYSKMLSVYTLEGNIIEGDGDYYSPVSSLCGSFPCAWKNNSGNITFIKASGTYRIGGIYSGNEPYSEYYASIIAEYLGFEHIDYRLREYKRVDGNFDIVTECDCYTTEDVGSISASDIGINNYEELIGYCWRLNLESFKRCLDMLFLDCLLLNTDRRFESVKFFVDNKTLKVLDIVPIFGNNQSLLPRFIVGADIFNRNEYKACDGMSFDELYKLIRKHKSYANELRALKKLILYKPDGVGIEINRLKFLNKLLERQVKHLIKLG